MNITIKALLLATLLLAAPTHAGNIVVIGNGNVPKLDADTVQKIYTGRFVSVGGVNIRPVGPKPGVGTRDRFLQEFLKQDEEKYTAYWTVRRYIGKGAPPAELAGAAEIIQYVQSTPGAVGYIDEADLRQGINVIARK